MEIKKYLSAIGKKGGETTKKKHGDKFYKKLSRQGVKAREKKRAEIRRQRSAIIQPIINNQ